MPCHTQYNAMWYTVWPLGQNTHTHTTCFSLSHSCQIVGQQTAISLQSFNFNDFFYGSYWCSWNSCIMNEIPEGFLRILMLSTYFIQLISTSHLDVFAFYLLMTSLSQFICSFANINIVFPRPKDILSILVVYLKMILFYIWFTV